MSQTGLIKLVDVSSYWEGIDVPVSLIEIGPGKLGHSKVAETDPGIREYVATKLVVEPGYIYLHINAMGAGEYYGSNKNGDYFPEEQLKKYHKTFESDGYIYRHHINKDPAKSLGKVIFSVYNERMHRVELIAKVSKDLGLEIESNIAAGVYPLTSMGCKTPFDVCSICGNKAHTRAAYCEHIANGVNKLLPDGRKVMALNLGPLKFFDLSIVLRPADVTSSVLAKVAQHAVGYLSVDVAAAEGWTPREEKLVKFAEVLKKAAIRKVSELIKEVEGGEVMDTLGDVSEVMDQVQDPSLKLIPTLVKFPLSETLNAFAELGMAPSVKFMAELFAQKLAGTAGAGVGEAAEEATLSLPPSQLSLKQAFDILEMEPVEETPANSILVNLIRNSSDASLFGEEIEKRAYLYNGYMGAQYMQQLPNYVNMTQSQVAQRQAETRAQAAPPQGQSMLTTLLALGGAAILSRMYISSLVDEKVAAAKRDLLVAQHLNSRAKIDFEKTAEFASSMIDACTKASYYRNHKALK
jgi:hypothetical protein